MEVWGGDRRSFWHEAEVFRTAKWCNIKGFDKWFRRYAKNLKRSLVLNSADPDWWHAKLFSFCRSDLGIDYLQPSFIHVLNVLAASALETKIVFGREWEIDPPSHPLRHNLIGVASFLFAAHRLGAVEEHRELCNLATDILVQHQDHSGGWKSLSGLPDPCEPNVFATCAAIHALHFAKPLGLGSILTGARNWLWSKQNEMGYWGETSFDCVEMTVTVLDSIDLADGKSAITFDLASSTPKIDRRKTNPKKRGRRVSRDQEADKKIHDGFHKRKALIGYLEYEEYGKALTPSMTGKQVQAAIESHKKRLFPHRKK